MSLKGMVTFPPCDKPLKTFSASSLLSASIESETLLRVPAVEQLDAVVGLLP